MLAGGCSIPVSSVSIWVYLIVVEGQALAVQQVLLADGMHLAAMKDAGESTM
jgi:hypothetical protein